MKRFHLIVLLGFIATSGFSSSISRITLAELQAKAEIIVLGQVTKVVPHGTTDTVTIQVASGLKGGRPTSSYTFTLVSRGGLKDFDPALKAGDTGVFFLKSDKSGKTVKAYWGSVAIFSKKNFDVK